MPTSIRKLEKIYHLVWEGSLFDKNPSFISESETNTGGFNGLLINNGHRIMKEWPGSFTVYVHGSEPVDYFLCGAYYSVVSDKVRNIIQKLSDKDGEFLPIKVLSNSTKQEIGKYWVLNIINNIDGLDWEHTTWTTREIPYSNIDAYLNIIKPAIKAEYVQNENLFLLNVLGKIRPGIYLSGKLKVELERAKCVLGIKFAPVKVT